MTKNLYQQQDFPIFQNRMYGSVEEGRNCPKGEIQLVEDPDTGVVCNAAFRPELMVYDEHYQNEQGNSPSFQRHLEQVADIVERRLGKEHLVEVGCGKGYFLETLADRGHDITGFDPAYEGDNTRIRREHFSPGILDKARGLILRHVLEHIQQPFSFLQEIARANGGKGIVYIEVPCFDWICSHRAWFDIFYEHVNYFRLSDFFRMFGSVLDSGRLFGGQYLYVVADLASLQPPSRGGSPATMPPDFLESIAHIGVQQPPRPSAVWGAASKGVIFSLLMERAGKPVRTLIDINPAKQGKFIAATGLEVSSPAIAMQQLPAQSTIYVMNSNYMDEIKDMTQHSYTYIGIDHE